MTTRLWCFGAAGAMVALAIVSGLADRRRARRADPDRVGPISWPTVQALALVAALVAASIGLNS